MAVQDGSKPVDDAADAGTVTIRLFDADRTDKALDLEEALGGKVARPPGPLLWIDVDGTPDAATADRDRRSASPSGR